MDPKGKGKMLFCSFCLPIIVCCRTSASYSLRRFNLLHLFMIAPTLGYSSLFNASLAFSCVADSVLRYNADDRFSQVTP